MKFIAGFVVALVIMAGAALAIMYTGSYNVAASVPDNPIVEWYLSNTMIHSVPEDIKQPQLAAAARAALLFGCGALATAALARFL